MIVLVVLSLSLISLDQNGRTHSLTSGVKSVANDVYAPLRQGVLDIISPIGNFFAGAFNYGSVQAQNERLQRTLGQLRAAQLERGFEQNQLREITALQNLPFLQSLPTVTAETVDEYSSNFTATITLDKGRADGVDVGYPVVGAGGLVGQVIQAFHHTSVVRLVTDGQSKVGVMFGSDQATGIVDGQGPSQFNDGGPGRAAHATAEGRAHVHQQSRCGGLPSGHPRCNRPDLPYRSRGQPGDDPRRSGGRPQPAGLRRCRAVGAEHMTGRSMLRVALVIFIVLMVQQTVMVALRIGGAHPDLLWLLPITAALLDGPETGAIVGFWSGLAFDLVLPTPFGLSALVGCVLGFAVGSLTTAADPRATWLKPVAAVAGSVGADMLFAVLGAILGQGQMVQVDFLSLILVVGISSVVLVLPVNRLMRWALAGESNRRSLVPAQADGRAW